MQAEKCRVDSSNCSHPKYSLLDLKIELADRQMQACDLCPHHCLVDRAHGDTGYCGVSDHTAVHWEGILHGEEIELVPSHEVFLSGCTMRCAFCYSHEHITRPMSGVVTTPDELARTVRVRREQGAINLNLVGGEPTVHIPNILRALRALDEPTPIIWNSNMYATPAAMRLLDGVVDLFLGDIHFGNDRCAWKLGRIPRYLGSITRSFRMAVDSGASVIIRHLVMPGHLDCCAKNAMIWAKSHFPKTAFHLMLQYVPDYRATGDPILGRHLTTSEIQAARQMAREIGVCLYQESEPLAERLAENAGSRGGIGETVDIVVQPDGRVSFTRLLDGLLPVAAALNDTDKRVVLRRRQ